MNRCLRSVFTFALILMPVLLMAQAPAPQSFSADMKITTPKMGQPMPGKMFFDKSKMRMDVSMGAQSMSTIVDSTTQTSYVLMNTQKMYMQVSTQGNGPGGFRFPDVHQYDPDNPCASQAGTTCKKVGTETVNGRVCDKWVFTGKNGDSTVWVDQSLLFPIKSVQPDGSIFELSNIQEGPQAASLFTVPADYRKMDMGGMMGNRR